MKYVILDPNVGREDFIFREIRSALEHLGHTVDKICVCEENKLITEDDLSRLLDTSKPDRILWNTGVGFAFMKTWDNCKVPKIALCYDEPFSRICGTMLEDGWKSAATRNDFFIGIWDGYWRDRVKLKWGINSFATHLAVNEFDYSPRVGEPETDDNIVFYGMFQSIAAIVREFNRMPSKVKKFIKRIDDHLTTQVKLDAMEFLVNPVLKCGEEFIAEVGGDKIIENLNGDIQRTTRWIVWALAKNCMRVQVLRTTLRKYKVTMYCDMAQLRHAKEFEIKQLLHDCVDNLKIVDTSNYTPKELAKIPTYGKVHLQAIDPQSVNGGIPWRTFQTAACAMPLITDVRPEFYGAFSMGKDLLFYESTSDLRFYLPFWMGENCNFKDVGEAARERFLKEHTWAHRIADWEKWISGDIVPFGKEIFKIVSS